MTDIDASPDIDTVNPVTSDREEWLQRYHQAQTPQARLLVVMDLLEMIFKNP